MTLQLTFEKCYQVRRAQALLAPIIPCRSHPVCIHTYTDTDMGTAIHTYMQTWSCHYVCTVIMHILLFCIYTYTYICVYDCAHVCVCVCVCVYVCVHTGCDLQGIIGLNCSYVHTVCMFILLWCIYCYCTCCYHGYTVIGWLRLIGSLKLKVSFAKEPHKRDDILEKRLIILRSLLIAATS